MLFLILKILHLFFAGLLAGEEFIVCYGLRLPLRFLDAEPQTILRHSLIRRLRIVVPIIFLATILSTLSLLLISPESFHVWRFVGLAAIIVWILATFFGTVPINKRVLTWSPTALPENWRQIVRRWENLDIVRCWAAIAAFLSFLIASISAGP
ncbi:anthrone oxygenase family protein [Leptospira sp. SA-E8]|uniref:anthrone oxygenase family protein n=1 Tax=Leptospira sp. SA-E8 TaxID=3422259 RepID=UPI003EBB7A15